MSTTVTFDDVWRLFQESAQQMKETARQMKETDRKFQETDHQLREMRAETDRVIKDLSKQVGGLTGKWGQFVENLVTPACEK